MSKQSDNMNNQLKVYTQVIQILNNINNLMKPHCSIEFFDSNLSQPAEKVELVYTIELWNGEKDLAFWVYPESLSLHGGEKGKTKPYYDKEFKFSNLNLNLIIKEAFVLFLS